MSIPVRTPDIGSNMADDVSDIVWPRRIFEAKGGHRQKEHNKLWSYFSMTANYNGRYVHNQLVERHPKVTLHSWGLFFVLQVAL